MGASLVFRPGGWWGAPCFPLHQLKGPPVWLLDLLITLILPLSASPGSGPPASITLAGKVVTGLCFSVLFLCSASRVSMETGAAFVWPLLWANRCRMGIFLCSLPPLQFRIKEGGGGKARLTGGLVVAGGAWGRGATSPPAPPPTCCLVGLCSCALGTLRPAHGGRCGVVPRCSLRQRPATWGRRLGGRPGTPSASLAGP